jgi:hypothetical protein
MANDESVQNLPPETQSPELFTHWKPSRLPELASNGLPFSPTFILPGSENKLAATASCAESAAPFGFHGSGQKENDMVEYTIISFLAGGSHGHGDPQLLVVSIA